MSQKLKCWFCELRYFLQSSFLSLQQNSLLSLCSHHTQDLNLQRPTAVSGEENVSLTTYLAPGVSSSKNIPSPAFSRVLQLRVMQRQVSLQENFTIKSYGMVSLFSKSLSLVIIPLFFISCAKVPLECPGFTVVCAGLSLLQLDQVSSSASQQQQHCGIWLQLYVAAQL